RVYRCAKGFCHWEHARVVLANDLRIPDAVARPAYSAALKILHGPDDPRVDACFSHETRNIVRCAGRWVSADLRATYDKMITRWLATLPATWDAEGFAIPSEVDRANQKKDLEAYPPITPGTGVKIHGQWLDYPDDRVACAVPAPAFREHPPRY